MEIKRILKVSLVTVLAAVTLSAILWSLGFPAKAQSLWHMYFPLVSKDYEPPCCLALLADAPVYTRYIDVPPPLNSVVGEVENCGNDYCLVGNITCTLYDDNDNVVGSSDTYAYRRALAPGESTPFECPLYSPQDEYHHWTIDFSPEPTDIRPLDVRPVSWSYSPTVMADLIVWGTVQNYDAVHVSAVGAYMALYAPSYPHIVNAGLGWVAALEPGEVDEFSFLVGGWSDTRWEEYIISAYADH